MTDWPAAINNYIDSIEKTLRDIRRHLHAHPELSGEEYETTVYLTKRLLDAGLSHKVAPSKRGTISDEAGNENRPRIAMRADIDALPLQDKKMVDYRSKNPGVTHACGHDAHATMVLGAAMALHKCRDQLPWPVPWRAIFQPAEETMQGAEEMIEAGALENVARIVSLHVDPETPTGRAAFRCGPLTAASEELQVTIRGVGGHAARPHHSDDPIAVATQFINTIYQFIPRAVDSRDPVVVTFGMIRGGENANVIPEIVNLRGIMRTIRSDTAEQVRKRIIDIANGVAGASRATIDVTFRPGAAAVVNDDQVTDICISAAKSLLGTDNIDNILLPSMGAEDFSAYSTQVPGCMFRLGVASGDTNHFLHSPSFDIDEKTLAIGAKLLAHCVVMLAEDSKG